MSDGCLVILIDSHKDVRFIDFSFYFKQHSQTQTGIREKHLERFAREREKSLICTQILKKIQQKKKRKGKSIGFSQNLSIKITVLCRSPRRWREKKRG